MLLNAPELVRNETPKVLRSLRDPVRKTPMREIYVAPYCWLAPSREFVKQPGLRLARLLIVDSKSNVFDLYRRTLTFILLRLLASAYVVFAYANLCFLNKSGLAICFSPNMLLIWSLQTEMTWRLRTFLSQGFRILVNKWLWKATYSFQLKTGMDMDFFFLTSKQIIKIESVVFTMIAGVQIILMLVLVLLRQRTRFVFLKLPVDRDCATSALQ